VTDPRLERWLDALLETPGLTAIADREQARRVHVEGSLAALSVLARFAGPIVDVGSGGGSPGAILSTASMPERTSPTTVYLPLRKAPSAYMMKNCEFAEFGSFARAMPTMPRLNGTFENSAGKLGYFEPPVPSPRAPSPVCAMKPAMTRWNGTLS